MQTGPSTQHAACDYAARCVSNRSALQWRLQRAAFLGAKCSGDFQGTEERSVVGVPHPYPEQFAARCIMFRSYAKPPRNIRENCCALLRACQGPLGEPDTPFPPSKERPCAKRSSPHYLPPERNGDCPLPHFPRCSATVGIQQALLLPPLMGRWEEGFLWGRRYAPYASGSAASAASGCSSEKSVTPFSTSRSYHWMSFLISEICTRSRS